jgi:hypothetical protein
MEINEVRLNTHQQHLESLVMSGEDGLQEINYKLDNFIRSFDDVAEPLNIGTKIDGAPAVQIYSNIGDNYPKNSIGLKSVISSPKNAISSTDQIDSRYNERPGMSAMLKYCLDLAPCIPEGEIWQGDCLFTKNTKSEVKLHGQLCIIFQPNKVVYSFSEQNPDYGKINSADFGICFHTIYKVKDGNLSQSFNVDLTRLKNPPGNFYIMKPIVRVAPTGFDTSEARSNYQKLIKDENKLIGNKAYRDLTSNEQFMKFWSMFENKVTSDKASQYIDTNTFYNELKSFIEEKMDNYYNTKLSKLKTDKGKQKATNEYQAQLQELESLLENNKETLSACVLVFNDVVKLKSSIFNHLKASGKDYDTYLYKANGEYEPTSGEGFSISDQEGNIVKIVDRSEFSHANRSKEYLSGFEHESLQQESLDDGSHFDFDD